MPWPPLRPISAPRYFERNLKGLASSGDCLPFDTRGRLPFFVHDGDSWDTILQRLPADWRPDFVVLDLDYTTIPHCLWNAPVPVIGLAPDWNLLWHAYRQLLKHVDLVLTDIEGVEHLAKEGIDHAIAANLFGLQRDRLALTLRASRKKPRGILTFSSSAIFIRRCNVNGSPGWGNWPR